MNTFSQDAWLAVGVGLFVLMVLAIALLTRRERKPAASTDAKLDVLDRRLGVAEEQLKLADHDLRAIRMVVGNLPTKESISSIAVQVAESRGNMEGMKVTLQSQTKSLDRIEDWLMKTSAEVIADHKASKLSNGDRT